MSLFDELKRRRVFRLIAVYVVIAWVIIQVVTAIEEPLSLPDWFDTAVIVLLGFGFPIAIIMSWVYDVTPEGVVREDDSGLRAVRIDYGKIALVAVLLLGAFLAGIYITAGFRIPATVEPALSTTPRVFEIGISGHLQDPMGAVVSVIDIAPDGEAFYVTGRLDGETRLFSRTMNSLDLLPVEGATDLSNFFAISADGQSAVFGSRNVNSISKIPTSGGIPIEIANPSTKPMAFTWSIDGSIVFEQQDVPGLMKISSAGGTAEQISFPDAGLNHKQPSFIPGADALVLVVGESGYSFDRDDRIAILTGNGEIHMVGVSGASPRVSADGRLVFFNHSALWAVDFDLDTFEITGEPVPIVNDVLYIYSARFDISNEGSLVYYRDSSRGEQALVWVDRRGNETPSGIGGALYNSPSVSPGGEQVAVTVDSSYGLDLWTYSFDRGTPARWTDQESRETSAVWSPDGRYVYFEGGASGDMFRVEVGGDGQIEPLIESERSHWPWSISSDGGHLFISESGSDVPGRFDISQFDVSDGSISPILHTEYWESHPEISPDGRWLAYMSNRSGAQEIYVRSYPTADTGGVQVSVGGGWLAKWNEDGSELFYWGGSSIMSVPIDTTNGLSVGEPIPLFSNEPYVFDVVGAYDFDPVRGQFLMIKKPPPGSTQDEIILIQNWPALIGFDR